MKAQRDPKTGKWLIQYRYTDWQGKRCKLIIIDTLQKVREIGGDKYNYGSDYEIVARLKAFSDQKNLCLLVVHHTRKMESEDAFDMISGTNGLLGAADGAFIMQKKKRTEGKATLSIAGRDQQDQELSLEFKHEQCVWQFIKAENEVKKTPPDPLLQAISKLLTPLTPIWRGTSSELLAQLGDEQGLPHHLTKHLNANVDIELLPTNHKRKVYGGSALAPPAFS